MKQWSLLIGGLSRAADMPGLAHQVVPTADEICTAAQRLLGPKVIVTGGEADRSVRLGLSNDTTYEWPHPRRYDVMADPEVAVEQLYDVLVTAVLDVAPLPSGIVSNWTVRLVLEDEYGMRVADRIVEIPQGGGRRRLLSASGMSGIALGGLAGAAVAGPVGAIVGMVVGGAAGEVLEHQFPSEPKNGTSRRAS
jgi:hypothetical protein